MNEATPYTITAAYGMSEMDFYLVKSKLRHELRGAGI